jgi:hypothetical protein
MFQSTKKLPGGVLYRQLKAGQGKSPETSCSCVCVCKGTLVDGTVFFNGSSNSADGVSCTLIPSSLVQVHLRLLRRQPLLYHARVAGAWYGASCDARRRSMGNSRTTTSRIRRPQAWYKCMCSCCEPQSLLLVCMCVLCLTARLKPASQSVTTALQFLPGVS